MKKLCWFTFLIILSVSCLDDPDCFQLHNQVIGITFRVLGTGQADSTHLKNFPAPGKTTFAPYLAFYLNYFQEQAQFAFQGEKEDNILDIAYKVRNQFVSEDCGSRFVLSDLKILAHDFDSARVVNATPGKAPGVASIDIFRCPETDTLTINFNQLYAASDGVLVSSRSSNFVSHDFKVKTDFSDTDVFSGRAATLYLPVNLNKNTTTYNFTRAGIPDSLVVSYERRTEQRFNPCGIQTFVSALKRGAHSFDSVSYGLNDDEEPQYSLLDPHTVNLRVYDCPKMNLLQVNFVNAANSSQSVLIKGVKAEHLADSVVAADETVSTLTLPVDTEKDQSTFHIKYATKTETLTVHYSRTPVKLYNACGLQMIIQNLTVDAPARVATNGAALKFPTVPNVEIPVN
jgi:hypothetical protein